MLTQDLEIEKLYRECGHVVLRRARSILGSEHAAQEVLQELFVSLLDKPTQFAHKSSATTFLYSMTTNMCLNRLRNQRKRAHLLAKEGTAGERVESSLESQLLATELLASLPKRLATVAVHYYIDEMTQDEIAEILGVSRRMVGKLIDKLKLTIQQEEVAA